MFELIIIIAIVIYFAKYSSKNKYSYNLNSILEKNGFSNFKNENYTSFATWMSAIKNGDNYLFFIPTPNTFISVSSINSLVQYAKDKHIHNVIVINTNSLIPNDTEIAIKNNKLIVWNKAMINSLSKTNEGNYNENTSTIVNKMPLDDNCEINKPDEPIQDGRKANTIFGNLFGNKIEKL